MRPTRDDGFTLVELLIVIVILGVLSTVTTFAVRGISDRAEESACATEFDVLVTAQEAHRARSGAFGDEAELVAGGMLTGPSERFTVATADGGTSYTITPDGDGCSETGGGSDVAAPPGPADPPDPPGPVAMPSASFGWHGGVTAWRYGPDAGGANEIVVIGGNTGRLDWVAAHDAAVPSPRRTHFIDITGLRADEIDGLISSVNNNGVTLIAVYTADDTAAIEGSAATSVTDYLTGSVDALAAYPLSTFTTLGAGELSALLTATAP